ncbi:MAG: ATP-binding protein [Myxococcaceae bacterium]|nr:ATP-binding protein [Myxococcaceae bacterium]
MLHTLAFDNYRSLRSLRVRLGALSLITGINGTGKSNLYRALHMLSHAVNGELGRALAREGGMPSAFWAGPERSKSFAASRKPSKTQGTSSGGPKRLAVGFLADDFGYELKLGLPPKVPSSAFSLDPEVKEEWVWLGDKRTPRTVMLERSAQSAFVRDEAGTRVPYPLQLDIGESVLSQLREPHRYPEISALRERIRGFRFYHHFRVDELSPIRQAQVGTRTPVLGHDGSDLAAALQTILEIGDDDALQQGVAEAFEGAQLQIEAADGRFEVALRSPGMLRPLRAAELSDGTLRFLCLLAALLSPHPPELLVLNEPEASLHPRLLVPLARLVGAAAQRSQVLIVSHAHELMDGLYACVEPTLIELTREDGETRVLGQSPLEEPAWPE